MDDVVSLGRRAFLDRALPGAAALTLSPGVVGREIHADLVIVGGGFGGCAAALAAARHGLQVVMTEETDWVADN